MGNDGNTRYSDCALRYLQDNALLIMLEFKVKLASGGLVNTSHSSSTITEKLVILQSIGIIAIKS